MHLVIFQKYIREQIINNMVPQGPVQMYGQANHHLFSLFPSVYLQRLVHVKVQNALT